MPKENPHANGAGASYELGRFSKASSQKRPIIQANPAMALRLSALRWAARMELRHDI